VQNTTPVRDFLLHLFIVHCLQPTLAEEGLEELGQFGVSHFDPFDA